MAEQPGDPADDHRAEQVAPDPVVGQPSRRRTVALVAGVGTAGLLAGALTAGVLSSASADDARGGPGNGRQGGGPGMTQGYGTPPQMGQGNGGQRNGNGPPAPPGAAGQGAGDLGQPPVLRRAVGVDRLVPPAPDSSETGTALRRLPVPTARRVTTRAATSPEEGGRRR